GAGDGETAGIIRADDSALRASAEAGSLASRFPVEERPLLDQPGQPSGTELLRAAEQHEPQIYYQPVVSLLTGHVVGAEALLPQRPPEPGLISPAAFAPPGEETGLMVPMGENLLREMCAQNHAWHTAGHWGLRLHVDLTARQLCDPDLPDQVRAALT